jgi:predicted GNAT family acetyltransferase
MNGVYVFRENADVAEVRALLMEVSRAHVPFCLQGRSALRGPLASVAQDLGMVPDDDVPLMVLDDPNALSTATHVDGLSMRLLTPDESGAHEDLFAAGFGMPSAMAHSIMEFFGGAPGLRAFVGEVAGNTVTTAVTVPSSHQSVAVFNVATPSETRGRGYGAAVTAWAALDGLDQGATFVWLQSSAAGHSIYQRLGFRDVESWPVWVTAVHQ